MMRPRSSIGGGERNTSASVAVTVRLSPPSVLKGQKLVEQLNCVRGWWGNSPPLYMVKCREPVSICAGMGKVSTESRFPVSYGSTVCGHDAYCGS